MPRRARAWTWAAADSRSATRSRGWGGAHRRGRPGGPSADPGELVAPVAPPDLDAGGGDLNVRLVGPSPDGFAHRRRLNSPQRPGGQDDPFGLLGCSLFGWLDDLGLDRLGRGAGGAGSPAVARLAGEPSPAGGTPPRAPRAGARRASLPAAGADAVRGRGRRQVHRNPRVPGAEPRRSPAAKPAARSAAWAVAVRSRPDGIVAGLPCDDEGRFRGNASAVPGPLQQHDTSSCYGSASEPAWRILVRLVGSASTRPVTTARIR